VLPVPLTAGRGVFLFLIGIIQIDFDSDEVKSQQTDTPGRPESINQAALARTARVAGQAPRLYSRRKANHISKRYTMPTRVFNAFKEEVIKNGFSIPHSMG
jgi:hypothetical protein